MGVLKVEGKKKGEKKVVSKDLLFEVKEFATQTEPLIVKGDEQITILQALALLLNKVERIEKGLL